GSRLAYPISPTVLEAPSSVRCVEPVSRCVGRYCSGGARLFRRGVYRPARVARWSVRAFLILEHRGDPRAEGTSPGACSPFSAPGDNEGVTLLPPAGRGIPAVRVLPPVNSCQAGNHHI